MSEPLPGAGGECEDVGFANLDLRKILLTGNDILEQELPGNVLISLLVAEKLKQGLCPSGFLPGYRTGKQPPINVVYFCCCSFGFINI